MDIFIFKKWYGSFVLDNTIFLFFQVTHEASAEAGLVPGEINLARKEINLALMEIAGDMNRTNSVQR
ncbi:MAG: hypothetical protein LBB61_04655 [Treponema sp.]|jgi:hypothetical protein|nr:hypothetical protein [Treponema sp.]